MIVVQMITHGLRAAGRAWRASLLLWAVNVVLAFVVSAIARSIWMSILNGSTIDERLLSGFDFTTVTEILRKGTSLTAAIGAAATWMVLLNLVAVSVLAGGVLKALQNGHDVRSIKDILSAAGQYAGRMLRLLGLQLGGLIVIGGIGIMLGGWMMNSAAEGARSELEIISRLIPAGIVVLLPIYFVMTIFMFARTILVFEDGRSVFRALLTGVRMFGRKFLALVPFHIVLYSVVGAIVWMHWSFDDHVVIDSFGTGALFFLVLQLTVTLRMFVRMWEYSAIGILVERTRVRASVADAQEAVKDPEGALEAEAARETTVAQVELILEPTPPVIVVENKPQTRVEKRKRPTKRRPKATPVPKRLPNKRSRR